MHVCLLVYAWHECWVVGGSDTVNSNRNGHSEILFNDNGDNVVSWCLRVMIYGWRQ